MVALPTKPAESFLKPVSGEWTDPDRRPGGAVDAPTTGDGEGEQQPPTAAAVGGRLTIGGMLVAGGRHRDEAEGRVVPLTLSGL